MQLKGKIIWYPAITSCAAHSRAITSGMKKSVIKVKVNVPCQELHNRIFVLFTNMLTIFTYLFRDGLSGKLTVDDYGAKTGRSPGKMRQLNINGPLYVGRWSSQLIIL